MKTKFQNFVSALVAGVLSVLLVEAATVTRGKTFTSNEQVTAAKLHQLVDSATVTGIVSADITDGTIASADILDDTIVQADIATGFLLTAGDIFLRVSGSCPSGSTNVTATYEDKFLRADTSMGTGGSDTHSHTADGTLATATHNHGGAVGGSSPNNQGCSGGAGCPGSDHGHTISSQAALDVTGNTSTESSIPAFQGFLLCRVD